MKAIDIQQTRIGTIELTINETQTLFHVFNEFSKTNARGSNYLVNAFTVLSCTNGNTLNTEITINNLLASNIEFKLKELFKEVRKHRKQYNAEMFNEYELKALKEFNKLIKAFNK